MDDNTYAQTERPRGRTVILVLSNKPGPFENYFNQLTSMNLLDTGDGGERQYFIGSYQFDTAVQAASFLAQSNIFDGITSDNPEILKHPTYLRAPEDGEDRVVMVATDVVPGIPGIAAVEEHFVYTATSSAFRTTRRGIGRLSAILNDLLPINDRLMARWNDTSLRFGANATAKMAVDTRGVRNTLLDQANATAARTADAVGRLVAVLSNPIMPSSSSESAAATLAEGATTEATAVVDQPAFNFSAPAPTPAVTDPVSALVEETRSAPEAVEAVIEALPAQHLQPADAIQAAVAEGDLRVDADSDRAPENAGACLSPEKAQPDVSRAIGFTLAMTGVDDGEAAIVGFVHDPATRVPQMRIDVADAWVSDEEIQNLSREVREMLPAAESTWNFINISLSAEAVMVINAALTTHELLLRKQASLFERGDFVQTKKRVGTAVISPAHLKELATLSGQWHNFAVGGLSKVDWQAAAA